MLLAKQLVAIITGVIFMCSLSYAGEKMTVNPYGKYLSDSAGLVHVELATFEEKNEHGYNDVILKMFGFGPYEAGIDGQAIRYKTVPAGSGIDFRYEQDGQWRTRVTTRELWGAWQSLQIYLDGTTYRVGIDTEQSKVVRPLHLLSALDPSNNVNKASREYEVNPYGIHFKSIPAGLEIEMATFSEKNDAGLRDVLLKISGEAAYSAGIDGITNKYTASHGGRGINWSYETDGQLKHRMVTREIGWSWKTFELFVNRQKFHIIPHAGLSRAVRPLHLLTEYKNRLHE